MAAVRWHDGAANIWIGSSKAPMQLASDLRPWRLRDYHWGADGRGLVLILVDAGVRQRRWIAWLDLRSGTLTRLTPELAGDPQYVGQLGADGPRILIAIADAATARSELQEVTDTGEVISRWPGPGQPVSSWVATQTQVVAASTTGSTTTWWHSPLPEVDWSRIAEMPAGDGHLSHPIAFSRDGGSLYAISSAGRDTLALVQMRPPAWSPVVLSAAEGFDLTTVLMSADSSQPDIAGSTDPQSRQSGLTPEGVADLARMAKVAGGAPARIIDRNATHCLAEVSYQSGGPAYLTFSRTTKAASRPLVRYTGLSRIRIHPREPFTFQARDGLPIGGFLTRPSGEPPWPAVVLIHDGPWARDTASMDPWAQYVASAGFCCVQVNFRGSRGFGKRFRDAGDRQWSRAMQGDLIDALRSAAVSAVIDRCRVAATGHGYGGYAALMLATQSELTLSCVVSTAAPTDLVEYVSSLTSSGVPARGSYAARIGDPAAEGERLAHASPVSRADDFSCPVMLFHGRQDARIPVGHATSLADALRRARKPHELVVYDDEGHWFTRPQNVADFRLRTVEFVLASMSQDADLEVSP